MCKLELKSKESLSGIIVFRFSVEGGKAYINVSARSEDEAWRKAREIAKRRLKC